MSVTIPEYLSNNEFVNHPMGNYGLYGLNMFGCDSVIRYNDEIFKFYSFDPCGSRIANYVNKYGFNIRIDPYDTNLQITRLINKKDLQVFVEC
jgi:hypothetical protein